MPMVLGAHCVARFPRIVFTKWGALCCSPCVKVLRAAARTVRTVSPFLLPAFSSLFLIFIRR